MSKTGRRRIGAGLAVLAALAVLATLVAAWMVRQGPVTVWRIVRHGDTTIEDHALYPFRALAPSAQPHRFAPAPPAAPLRLAVAGWGEVELGAWLEQTATVAFVVVRDERLLDERYLRGYDEARISQVFSTSKSVLSLLIGAAIEDGLIGSVDDVVTRYVPELRAGGFDKVRLVELLQMDSGMDYVEDDNPFGQHVRFNYTPWLEREILALRVEPRRETRFVYKSGENALLGLVLARALGGRTITQYTQQRLWDPLGMEHRGLWSLDREGGLEKTWCCLSATARDLAKIGMLVRDRGRWQGRPLLSAKWIDDSTRDGPHAGERWTREDFGRGFWNYGYQWWLVDRQRGDFTSIGKNGQFVYVDRARGVVIVRLGYAMGRHDGRTVAAADWMALFDAIAERSAAGR